MKTLILNHSYTPSPLEKINQDLHALTADSDLDQSKFLALAIERDKFIQTYIQTLDKQAQKEFAKAELKVNGALVAYAEQSFKTSLNELSGLVRGRKAIKQYK